MSPPAANSIKSPRQPDEPKRYRARDCHELFFRPKKAQNNKNPKFKKKTSKPAPSLTDKQRSAEAHAHYILHHGSTPDAAHFLQKNARARNISTTTATALQRMCSGTTTTSAMSKKIPPIPTWDEAAAAVFSSSSEESLASPPSSPPPITCTPSRATSDVQMTTQSPRSATQTTPTITPSRPTSRTTEHDAGDIPLMAAAVYDSSIFSSSGEESASPVPTQATPLLPHPKTGPTMPLCPSRRQTRSSTFEARRAAAEARETMQQHTAAVLTANTGVSAANEKSSKYRAKPSNRPKRVKVMTSTIPNAGLGLYLLEDAKKGECVARSSGEAITQAENATRKGHYRIKICSNLYLDAERPHHFEGRFINDGKRAGKVVNVRFAAGYRTNQCSETGLRWIRIFATRDIKAGSELYLDYGDEYWQDAGSTQSPETSVSTSPSQTITPAASPTLTSPDQQTYLPAPKLTLSPIWRATTRLQRAPPQSETLLIRPLSPWSPPTTPPRILGHYNPHTTHRHTQHTLILNDTLTLNEQNHSHTHTHYE